MTPPFIFSPGDSEVIEKIDISSQGITIVFFLSGFSNAANIDGELKINPPRRAQENVGRKYPYRLHWDCYVFDIKCPKKRGNKDELPYFVDRDIPVMGDMLFR